MPEGVRELGGLLGQVAVAVRQVMHAGTEAQVEAAVELLDRDAALALPHPRRRRAAATAARATLRPRHTPYQPMEPTPGGGAGVGSNRLPPALRRRDFALLWVALLVRGLGAQMAAVAVGWQVYEIHHSPLDLGLIGLAEFVPLPLLALPAGHLADRFSRRLLFAGATA